MQPFRVFTITLVLLTGLAGWTAEWPQFLGPNRNGFSPETGLNVNWKAKAPKQLWQVALSDRGYAGPAVAGGVLYIIDHQGKEDVVRALDAATGKPKWDFRYPDNSSYNFGFSRSTPTVAGGKVYTVSQQGKVHCLDAKTGKKVWMRDLVKEFGGRAPTWLYSMSALVDGNKVIVVPGAGKGTVAALDAASGKTLWQGGGNDAPGYATPVIATLGGVRQYLVFTANALVGVDPAKGKLLWRFSWDTQMQVNAAAPLVSGNQVFITSDYGKGCALVEVKGNKAKQLWANRNMQSHFSTPILHNGYIYGTSDPNKLVCLEWKSGKVMWEQRGFEKGAQSAVAGTLLAFEGASGNLVSVALNPKQYIEQGRFRPLGGQSWTAPIIAGGKLYVRNTGALACYNLK